MPGQDMETTKDQGVAESPMGFLTDWLAFHEGVWGLGRATGHNREWAEAATEQTNRCATRGRDRGEMPRRGLRACSFCPL